MADALIAAGKDVSYAEIESTIGHDAFLLLCKRYEALFASYMTKIAQDLEITA